MSITELCALYVDNDPSMYFTKEELINNNINHREKTINKLQDKLVPMLASNTNFIEDIFKTINWDELLTYWLN